MKEETATAIATLAIATLAGRETMTSMQATITTLITQLFEANQKLVDTMNVCTTLKEKVASTKNNRNNCGGRGNGDDDERRAPIVEYTIYCHIYGILSSHNSGDRTRPAAGNKVEATVDNKMGGCTTKWRRFGAGSWDGHTDIVKLAKNVSSNYICSNIKAIADSGASGTCLCANTPCVDKQICTNGVRVQQPNGDIMQATHTEKLVIDHLPEAVRQAHIFPQLENKCLLG